MENERDTDGHCDVAGGPLGPGSQAPPPIFGHCIRIWFLGFSGVFVNYSHESNKIKIGYIRSFWVVWRDMGYSEHVALGIISLAHN